MSSCKYDLSLLELIWRQRWPSVERRVIAHPYELDLEHHGLTALHWACCNELPARTLRVLLSKDIRGYALKKNNDGHTPLIMLLSNEDDLSIQCVQIYCEMAPEAVSIRDYFRRTPLHYVCSRGVERQPRSNLEIVKLFLQIDPLLATLKNSDGDTALDRLWKSLGYIDGDADDALGYFWTIVELILSAASQETDGGLLLHKLVSYPECRSSMMDYAIGWNPQLLHSTDDLGNTPLHRAVLHNRSASIVSMIVRRRPELASRRNNAGLLPIQLASNWKSATLEMLLQTYPQVVESANLLEAHYPQLIANSKAALTVFELLRTKPNLCPSSM